MKRRQRRRGEFFSSRHSGKASSGRPLTGERLEHRLALAVVTPFTVRFTANDTGDITFAANTLMTAGPPATPTQIANVQNGVGSKLNNNDFTMTYVDIDGDASTFNSSAAALVMPAGSQVLFAGLYWGARTNSSYPTGQTALRDNVKFKAPGDSGYTNLTGTTIGTTNSSYHSFKDVTNIVRAAGAGTYTMANVQAISQASDYYAGWSLVVAYRAPGEPARNLTVFDGYASVTSSDPTATINIAGFKAPTSGPVNATLGFITYEGDLGSTGDKVLFNGGTGQKQLSDAANPANNFFNSTISNRGSLVATKTPNYVNQMGYDADLINANGLIANGATSATIGLTTGGETYYPGVVTSSIEIFAPDVGIVKTVEDVNGGSLVPGDELRYTMVVSNAAGALDTAVNVLLTDAIPAGTTFKAGSLLIDGVAKTDAPDSDQAEYYASGNRVEFQLGTGAGGAGTSGGRLVAGQSTTVQFSVIVGNVPGQVIENVAEVTYSGETSGFNLTATDFANIAEAGADLVVMKTDNNRQEYVGGQSFDYTIVVTNNGPDAVVGARVVDSLPPEIEAATWTATWSAGSQPVRTGSGNIDEEVNLANGESVTFVVSVTVRAGSFGDLANTVFVINPENTPDPNPDNNTATDINTARSPGNLTIVKTVEDLTGSTPVQQGDTLRYTIVVTNPETNPDAPNETLLNVSFNDLIPSGTTFVPASITSSRGGLTYDVDTNAITGTLGNLAMGDVVTITFEVEVGLTLLPEIDNTAEAAGTGETSSLPYDAEGTATIALVASADLALTKTGPVRFVPGRPISYTIVVRNDGPSAVDDARVVDEFPVELSNVQWTAIWSQTSEPQQSGSGNINELVDLANGETVTFTITADTDSTIRYLAQLVNTATVTNPVTTPDPDPSNDSDSTTGIAYPETDLSVLKTADKPMYVPGQSVIYTITVRNDGPSKAAQVSVLDPLDASVINVAAVTWRVTDSRGFLGPTSDTGSLDTIIDLDADGFVTYEITAPTLSSARGQLVNTVTTSPSNQSNDPDPDPSDNTSSVTTNVLLPANLTVVKSVADLNGGVVQAGDVLRYTITVSNPGSAPTDAATNVILNDVIPTFTTYKPGTLVITAGENAGAKTDAVDADQAEFIAGPSPAVRFQLGTGAGAGTGTPVGGTLVQTQSTTVTFDVIVGAGIPDSTVITNTAIATGVGQESGQSLSATGSAGIASPPAADLKLVKTGPATFVPGQAFTYTLVVSNVGPSTSTGATVADTLPAGVTGSWTAAYAGGGSGAASGSGDINTPVTLPAGATATFTITVTPQATLTAALTNTATVTPTDGKPDPNPGDNTSTVTSEATPTADLVIVKTNGSGKSTYTPGEEMVYTITVTNNGPSFVTGATVIDDLPAAISFAEWTASITTGTGTVSGASGTGSINETVNLAPGAVATFLVSARVSSTATGNLVNTAQLLVPEGVIDPNPGNNTSTDTDTPVDPANLTVAKTVIDVNGGFIAAGDVLRYTITVSNPATIPTNPASNVALTDAIPALTTYVGGSARVVSGVATVSGSASGITATIGTLDPNETVTIEFEVTVNGGIPPSTTITNTASATGTDSVTGTPLSDDDTSDVSTPPAADLTVAKTGPATFVPGQSLTYTIVVSNSGPTDVTGARVVDTLSPSLTATSVTVAYTGGASGPATLPAGNLDALVALPVGSRATFTITASIAANALAALANTATVTNPAGVPDPNPQDNTSTITSTPTPVADLSIVKRPRGGSTAYTPGQPVVYEIIVSNTGPSRAVQAVVSDPLTSPVISSATWTASGGSGFTGQTSGSGSISQTIDLDPGATVTYIVTVQTNQTATASLVNTARVTPPAGTTDPDPDDNVSTSTVTPNFAPAIIVANDAACDSAPFVRVLDPVTGVVKAQFLAYEASFRGGVRVYGADVTGDGVEEIITGSGAGRPSEVRVFTQNGEELTAYRTFPFGRGFTGGVEVAAGPVTGLGSIDIVAAQGSGGNLVRVFSVTPGAADPVANTASRQFRPFGPKYTGGVRLATADIGTFAGSVPTSTSPDGIFEIIAGSGTGARATVVAQNAVPAATARIGAFNPIAPTYTRGVTVARMPGSGGAADRVLVSGGMVSGSRVETWSYTTTPTRRFVRDAAFAAYPGTIAAVNAAALDASNVFSVQGTAGKTTGVKKFTAPTGGVSSTLPSSTAVTPPQRISVLRR